MDKQIHNQAQETLPTRQGRALGVCLAFEVPLLLFLFSAALGIWVAYDTAVAWGRFWWVAGGLALAAAFAYAPQRTANGDRTGLSPRRLLFGVLPTGVAVYFLLTNDWTGQEAKIPLLAPVLHSLALWLPDLQSYQLHPNVVGGVIAAFLPLQVLALRAEKQRTPALTAAGVVLVAVSAVGLVASESRGAWLALAVVGGGWLLVRWLARRRRWVLWLGLLGGAGLLCVLLLALTPLGEHLLALRPDRLEVWRNSLDLASDYSFTGLGLSGFTMAYSSYVLLVHVPHTIHAHNLLLDIYLQQGLLGLAAFLWLVVALAWPRQPDSPWAGAARASLAVILLHGLLDDAFYGYGGYATPLLFLPLGLLAGASRLMGRADWRSRNLGLRTAGVIAGTVAVLVAATWLLPGLRAAFEANLGAVFQTRAELSVYSWPAWPIQDAVRRSPEVDLREAISRYEIALRLDSANATANRRLGQIELSLGQYDEARRHMLTAYRAAPGQRATLQLLGEAYAVAGEIEDAAELWGTIEVDEDQLQLRRWWYGEYLHDGQRAEWLSQAAIAAGR
ncbi:MAG: O-antigen ligase family protein [Chloroflexota bacterium]